MHSRCNLLLFPSITFFLSLLEDHLYMYIAQVFSEKSKKKESKKVIDLPRVHI